MANTVITVNGHLTDFPTTQASDKQLHFQKLADYFLGLAAGMTATVTSVEQRGTAVAATGTITFATSSGTVGATINGTLVTVTWATSDTLSAAALAVAINAAAGIVSDHVTATSALGVITLTAKNKGVAGNAITLALSGTNVTVSGTRLTGGSQTLVTYSL